MSTVHRAQVYDADIIQRNIIQIEEMMRRLPLERIALLQRLNSVCSSTRVFPVEVLSLIFELVCNPPVDDEFMGYNPVGRHPAIVLGHVSSQWRQIVRCTSQLWRGLSLNVNERSAHRASGILELYLQNVGGVGFSLNLQLVVKISKKATLPLRAIIFKDEYSKRFQRLRLFNAPAEWIRSFSADFSRLECLFIEGRYQPSKINKLFLEKIPSLHRVELSTIPWNISLPQSSITHLALSRLSIDIAVKLLIQCPNLVEYESTAHDEALGNLPVPHLPDLVTFIHLQDFSWSFQEGSAWCSGMLQHVRFVNLRKLTWNQYRIPEDHSIGVFFYHLPNTLTTLHLINITTWPVPFIRHIFNRNSSIQNLTLEDCDGDLVEGIFGILCPHLDIDGVKILPSLTCLDVIEGFRSAFNDHYAINLDTTFSELVLELCRGRFTGPGSKFSLDFFLEPEGWGMEWLDDVRDELRAMVRGGFELRITVMDKYMEWDS